MGFFQCNFFSPTLCFNTDVHVFLPTPNSDEILNNKHSDYFRAGVKFQVLYLLHGAYGDYGDWMRLTSIEKYAQEHKLAVVMPSASNSFYQNMHRGSNYLTYISKELPSFIQSIFPVSAKREDTFIAGLSMGGYGAVRVAFELPENYAACASLSGALDFAGVKNMVEAGAITGPFRWDAILADKEEAETGDANLFVLADRRMREGRTLPRLFQTCGTEDFIYPQNIVARDAFMRLGLDLTYEEHPGIHDWNYWDTHIQRVLDWFGLADDSIADGRE